MRTEQMLELSAAVEHLPEAQRQAIVMHYWQGETLLQIATELQRTPAGVAGLLHRGLKKLRGSLERQTDR